MSRTAPATAVTVPRARTGRSPTAEGVAGMLPLVVAYAPFAAVIGATVADRGDALAGWAGSWLIYGGSAHLAAIRGLDDGGAAVAILTGLLVHARLLVYSAALARRWAPQPRWFRVAAAPFVIDPTWAAAEGFAERCADPVAQRRHFAGAALTLGIGWSLAMAAGVVLRDRLGHVDLEVAVPLCLLALVGDALRASTARRIVLAAGLTAWLTAGWPSGTGILAAVAVGALAGRSGEEGAA